MDLQFLTNDGRRFQIVGDGEGPVGSGSVCSRSRKCKLVRVWEYAQHTSRFVVADKLT